MEIDDAPPRPRDLVAELAAQDLDRLSLAELEGRIATLEAEVARSRAKVAAATRHRASADALFRR